MLNYSQFFQITYRDVNRCDLTITAAITFLFLECLIVKEIYNISSVCLVD